MDICSYFSDSRIYICVWKNKTDVYFMNLISNLVDTMEFLKYLTPFSYTDSAYIYEHSALNLSYLLPGLLLAVLSLTVGALHYRKKDI